MNYYKSKLIEKLDLIFRSRGIIFESEIIKDNIFDDIEYGCYEIVFNASGNSVFSLIKIRSEIKVLNGKYHFDSKSIYSSQFITFDIQEEREFKINRLLNMDKNLYICKKENK
jgi:hypothetical protein